MTTVQILQELKSAGKSIKVAQLYRYFRKLKIKPQGAFQRPRHYLSDTPAKILIWLGWQDIKAERVAGFSIPPLNGESPAKTNNQQKGHLAKGAAASRIFTSGARSKTGAASHKAVGPRTLRAGELISVKQLRAERAKGKGTK
jgi:hypothetical protein